MMKVKLKPKPFTHRLYDHPAHPLRRAFILIVTALAVLGAIVIAGGLIWYQSNLQPLSTSTQPVLVDITEGMSLDDISRKLEAEEVIRSSSAFSLYATRSGQRVSLQTGLYKFNPSQSVDQILSMMVEGETAKRRITVPEGASLIQIEQALLDAGYTSEEVNEALNATYNHPVRDYAPEEASLEGYLYPDTYIAGYLQEPSVIIELALDELQSTMTDDVIEGLSQQGLSPHQGIILASIVTRESTDSEEQRIIAQVFYKRLAENINLGADPTFRYAAELEGVDDSVSVDSPYNTRLSKNKGLPPGPIGAVTKDALEAVANPASTDYLYFVHGDDGEAHFSRTLDEHEANVEKYCQELCRL